MYLKSITLKGFKSFPDRTRLEFGPGVSVVVGPNGSGKSNVTDAVLWALGEQSPVAVRGQSMQDVIFGGAPGRQAAKQAEVELVLDDADGKLGLGAPEVSIVRRLDRAGEGEYRLAGARCRLVDVIELLSDTGLGKEMHSVISQGRVESIVTSKPRDRRLLIEEAAGLGKHRKRRRRAQLKLARTQENLDRALDVEREARTRLRPLKRQAEAAELHARLERQSMEARWELARDALLRREQALADAGSVASELRDKRERLERELEAVSKRRELAEEALAQRSAKREELSRRCYVAQAAAERIAYRADAARSAAGALQDRLTRGRALIESLRGQTGQSDPDPETDQRIAALEQSLASLRRGREAELAEQLAELEQRRERAEQALGRQAEVVQRRRSERAAAEHRADEARAGLREAERSVEAARREAARVGGELAAVNQFLRSQSASLGAAAALADELVVDPGYELAVSAALDGRLRAAVVPDRATGAALLDGAGADGGRTLVAGTGGEQGPGVQARRGTPDRDPAGAPVPGAEPLAAHVRGTGTALELVRALLRDTWVTDALEELPAGFGGIAVTRSGRVWSAPTRELRQAPAVGEDRVLAERNRRERLVQASVAAAQGELDARTELSSAAATTADADAALDGATAAHRAAVKARDEAQEELSRIAVLIERRAAAPATGSEAEREAELSAQLAAAHGLRERIQRERAAREGYLARLERAVALDAELEPALQGAIEALDGAAGAISMRLESFDHALVADREAGEHVAGELRACAQREAALHAELHRENELLTEAEVRLQRARDQAAEAGGEVQQLSARLGLEPGLPASPLSAEEHDALSTRLERLARRREQLGPVNPLAQEEYADAVAHVEELETQRSDLETALRELEQLIADTDRQIRETFERTFAATARNFEELAEQLFPGGRGRLRLVTERERPARVLGGVAAEPADGAEPEDEDEQDALPEEELLGVEIEITPAGKEMKRLSLLSGGEKSMTALAFLFAVFLARPCPFYILDEVEAALDDLNIDRFLGLLRQYAARAQFIVVTHQKRTMEAADTLYGVSMGADGISKVISRRLGQARAA